MSVLAICDRKQEYVNSLMSLFQGKKELPFEVHGFTQYENIQKFCEMREIELLIISESEYKEEFSETVVRKVILLTDQKDKFCEKISCVYKYQSAENLYRSIMQAYSEGKTVVPLKVGNTKDVQIIGIYSPIHRVLQTTLALTMGQILAEKKKVLYVNFECYSGLESLMGRKFSGNLTDLLYFYQCDKEKIPYKLEGIIQRLNGLHMIPPSGSYEDFETLQGGEWISVLEMLAKAGGYQVLLLDLSEQVRGLFQILERCEKVYTIITDDRMAKAKLAQYELLLQRDDYGSVLEKTSKCELPVFKCLPTELERLNRCELALYAKTLLAEGGFV